MIAVWMGIVLAAANGAARFADVTDEAGIRFRHHHGGSGEKHLVETMAGGGGLWDYDGDGDLDIYFLNGAPLPGYDGPRPLENALYRNEGGRFTEVTVEAGLLEPSYSLGSIAGDYDNDGDLDLFITSFGTNHLYRNNGDGTFTEVSETAGITAAGLWASAAFFDIEGDGDLDLYVTNYTEYSLENPVYCGNKALGLRTYCHPDNYQGAPDVLYRNEGDGTFEDVTREAGVEVAAGRGLGVIATDYDEDGDPDVYVANDSEMNFLFKNLGGGRFEETALAAGVGFDEEGRAEGSMGVDAADYDGDGKLDLFVTNYEAESNTLYRNLGDGTFADTTYRAGLALPSLSWVGFGTNFFDMDNDADQDLFVANGHIMDQAFLSDTTTYPQRKQVYENEGGRFKDVSSGAGEVFEEPQVGRGTAFGDWDDDGDPDVLVLNNDDVPNLLRNETENGNHWTLLRIVGRRSNRDGIGAFIRIETGGKAQVDELRSGTSYLAQNDLRLHFGLGATERIDRIEIRWPSGSIETFADLPVDRRLLITEGGEAERLELYRP
jgi:hypothetical protein